TVISVDTEPHHASRLRRESASCVLAPQPLPLRVTLVPTLVPRYRFANATATKIASRLGRANPPAALDSPQAGRGDKAEGGAAWGLEGIKVYLPEMMSLPLPFPLLSRQWRHPMLW
ncbi:MAG: hypothetical protein PUP93_32895, partial [Rhizonema sp. NSF051]|nr:hypothetical protein [Rhizonema sp. NSF051]